jgi:hypothetical protein
MKRKPYTPMTVQASPEWWARMKEGFPQGKMTTADVKRLLKKTREGIDEAILRDVAKADKRRKLANHVKLCRRNLKSSRVKCCAGCPFEDEITQEYPELKMLFEAKRKVQK